jgi:phosphoribosyl-ATP pyrophosphohydrolase
MSRPNTEERKILTKLAEEACELAFACLKRVQEGGHKRQVRGEIEDVEAQLERFKGLD